MPCTIPPRTCSSTKSGLIPPLQIRLRSTLFSGRTGSSWRFRSRKTGNCGWPTPASDAAKVVLLGEVLKLRGAALRRRKVLADSDENGGSLLSRTAFSGAVSNPLRYLNVAMDEDDHAL